MKNKILYIIILLFLVLIVPIKVNATPSKNFVYDNANILEDDTIDYINEYSDFLYKNNSIDYYVITINENNIKDIDNYSEDIYESYNINKKGLLILYLKKERTIKVIVGEKLSDIISGNIIDEYIDNYFIKYFKKENYNQGIKNGYSAFYKLLCNYYNIDSTEMKVYDDIDIITKYKYPIIMLVVWIEAILCYIFFKYFKKIYSKKEENLTNHFIFMITLFINILLFVFAYTIEKTSIFIILLFEIIEIITEINEKDNKKINKVKKKKKRSKK